MFCLEKIFFFMQSIPVLRRISRREVQEKCQQVALDFQKKVIFQSQGMFVAGKTTMFPM